MKPTFRQLRNAAILLVCLFGGAAVIRTSTPAPFIEHVTPKLEHLRANSEAYDILFVGSSRVYRQVMPRVFDRRLRHRGVELSSFNAGIPAARSVEVWHFMRLLAEAEVRARYVLVEPDGLFMSIHGENLGTQREVYWHEGPETALAIRSLAGQDTWLRLQMSVLHLGAFAGNRLGIGRLRLLGSDLISTGGGARSAGRGLGPGSDGWAGFTGGEDGPAYPRRREFLDNLPAYRELIAAQPGLLSRTGCATPYHDEMLLALAAAAEALGAEPVFILSPATRPRCEVHDAHRRGLLPSLLALDDARIHPRLYDVANRFDAEHLNTDGAVIYSRLLADAFADHLEEGGP
jgi:hypothetical protein